MNEFKRAADVPLFATSAVSPVSNLRRAIPSIIFDQSPTCPSNIAFTKLLVTMFTG